VVELSATVAGDPPLAYQWLFNDAKIFGATNSSLAFNDVARARAGGYAVVVSNPVGVATSAPPAALTVVTPPVCAGAPGGMVAWWQGNDTSDYAGTNDAVFVGMPAYGPGEVGQAFNFDGTNSYLQVANGPLWDLRTNDFSFEFWASFDRILPSLIVGDESIVFLAHDQESGTPEKWLFGLGAGALYFYIDGTGTGPQFLVQSAFDPQTNQWYHLGLTKTSNVYRIYVDGSQVSAQTNNLPIPTASAPLTIGAAQGLFMPGLLDEISIYNRALKANEMLAIYQAGNRGKCQAEAGQALTLEQPGLNSVKQFQFQILGGQAGTAIQVQASSDLKHWSNIGQVTNINGIVSFTDPAASLDTKRFYRASPIQ
jgi:hypothetical protein